MVNDLSPKDIYKFGKWHLNRLYFNAAVRTEFIEYAKKSYNKFLKPPGAEEIDVLGPLIVSLLNDARFENTIKRSHGYVDTGNHAPDSRYYRLGNLMARYIIKKHWPEISS